jgi:hypothetical protein
MNSILVGGIGWLLVAADWSLCAEPAASIERPEQRFVLFQPAGVKPVAVPAAAQQKVETNPDKYEVLHSRWVRLGDFDPEALRPGDRLLIEVSPGDSYELVISKVERVANGIGTFVYGRFLDPNYPYSHLFLEFARLDAAYPRATFSGGKLEIPGQARVIVFKTVAEMPGWSSLQEVKPGSGMGLGNDLEIVKKP